MRFGKKGNVTVKRVDEEEEQYPKTKVLEKYVFCEHCDQVLVKIVHRTYGYKPLCKDCRKQVANYRKEAKSLIREQRKMERRMRNNGK